MHPQWPAFRPAQVLRRRWALWRRVNWTKVCSGTSQWTPELQHKATQGQDAARRPAIRSTQIGTLIPDALVSAPSSPLRFGGRWNPGHHLPAVAKMNVDVTCFSEKAAVGLLWSTFWKKIKSFAPVLGLCRSHGNWAVATAITWFIFSVRIQLFSLAGRWRIIWKPRVHKGNAPTKRLISYIKFSNHFKSWH